jgi:predicted nucleic acid-binding protein
MRILVDTNVFLDVLMARSEWLTNSRHILDWCDAHPGQGWIAWHTLSNLYYIGAKTVGTEAAHQQIDEILEVFEVATGDTESARLARRLRMGDFEDALQAVAAQSCTADAIITRNLKDFKNSPVKALSPAQFTKLANK